MEPRDRRLPAPLRLHPGRTDRPIHPGGAAAASVAAALAVPYLAVSLARLARPPAFPRATPRTLLIALTTAASPAAVLACLPWEDPYTGAGSPMATLLGILTLTAIGAALMLPGAVLLFRYVAKFSFADEL